MQCEQVEMRLAQFVYGELPDDEKAEVLAHLAECPKCAEALGDMRVASRLLAEAITHGPAPALSPGRRATLLDQTHAARVRRVRRFGVLQLRRLGTIAAMLLIAVALVGLLFPTLSKESGAGREIASRDHVTFVPLTAEVTTDGGGDAESYVQHQGAPARIPEVVDELVEPVPGRTYFGKAAASAKPKSPTKATAPGEPAGAGGRTLYANSGKRPETEKSSLELGYVPRKPGTSGEKADKLARRQDQSGSYDLYSFGRNKGKETRESGDDITVWSRRHDKKEADRPAPDAGRKSVAGKLTVADSSGSMTRPVPGPRPPAQPADPNTSGEQDARLGDGKVSRDLGWEGRSGEGELKDRIVDRVGGEADRSGLQKSLDRLEETKKELASVTHATERYAGLVEDARKQGIAIGEGLESSGRVLYRNGDGDELDRKSEGEKLAYFQKQVKEKKKLLKKYENSINQLKSRAIIVADPKPATQPAPVEGTEDGREREGRRERDKEEETLAEGQGGDGPETLPPSSSFRLFPVNPFVLTAKDRFSTFALDVDTASYALAANYIRRGYRPPPGAIRIEEFVNAFDYNYTRQSRRVFTVQASAMPSPFGPRGRDLVLLKIGVRGRVLGREGRKPAHVVFVVDASGSMARSDRMPLVQYAVSRFVGKLRRGDRVSLVTFGTGAHLLLERVEVSGGRKGIVKAVETIQCGGSTNLLDGLRVAYAVARRGFATGAINRIVLCSDGVANVGLTDAESMLGEVASLRRQGITFMSAGFGIGAYNDALLEQLANRGDGSYAYVGSRRDARRVFAEEMSATLQTIARDAKIQVAFDPARVRRYRLIGYENRDIADKDFRNDAVDAGEVGSGQSATALYELELRRGDWGAVQGDLGTVYVRYEDLRSEKVEEVSRRLEGALIARRSVRAAPRFHLAACAAEFAEILRESEHARGGSLRSVRHVLEEVARELPLDRRVRELLYLVARAQGLPKAP
jgi:Ca-activated chloride channel family protein